MTTRRATAGSGPVDFSLFGGAETLPPSLSEPSSASSSASASASEDEASPSTARSTGRGQKYKSAGEEWAPKKVVPEQDPNDWLWLMTEEPHRSRRRAIIKSHPEVRSSSFEPVSRSPTSPAQAQRGDRSHPQRSCLPANASGNA